MNNSKAEIGNRIREIRKQKGLSQTELATLLDKSLRTVQKYESGEIEISIATINELAQKLDTTSTYLIGYEPNGIHIDSLSDVLAFLFQLERKSGVNFNIDVKKPKTDGEWKCSVTFEGQDITADYNSQICLFLEEYANCREKLETYWISRESYEDWQNKQLAYYASSGLQESEIEKIDDTTRLKKRNELMREQLKPHD